MPPSLSRRPPAMSLSAQTTTVFTTSNCFVTPLPVSVPWCVYQAYQQESLQNPKTRWRQRARPQLEHGLGAVTHFTLIFIYCWIIGESSDYGINAKEANWRSFTFRSIAILSRKTLLFVTPCVAISIIQSFWSSHIWFPHWRRFFLPMNLFVPKNIHEATHLHPPTPCPEEIPLLLCSGTEEKVGAGSLSIGDPFSWLIKADSIYLITQGRVHTWVKVKLQFWGHTFHQRLFPL